MADFSRPRYEATVITTAFQITGQIEPFGPWLDYLNTRDKIAVPVYNAHILAIGTAVGTAPEKPQVYVNCQDIYLIYLPGNFFPITNADLHARVALPAPLPHKADMMLVNRQHVAIYHPT